MDADDRARLLYGGDYVQTRDGARTRVTVRTADDADVVVLASGATALLDWETTPDKANVLAAVLRHWLGRAPTPDELHEGLDGLVGDWVQGRAWELTGAQLLAAGFEPTDT